MGNNNYSGRNRDYSGEKRNSEGSRRNYDNKRYSRENHHNNKEDDRQESTGRRAYRKDFDHGHDHHSDDRRRYHRRNDDDSNQRKSFHSDRNDARPYRRKSDSDESNYRKDSSFNRNRHNDRTEASDEEKTYESNHNRRHASYNSDDEGGYRRRNNSDYHKREFNKEYHKKYTRSSDNSYNDDTKDNSQRKSFERKKYERKSSSDWSESRTFFPKDKKEQQNRSSRRPYQQKESSKKSQDNDEIRLNRYISNSGVCSRREADELIEQGEITVNGVVVTELGVRVHRNDTVQYKGKTLSFEKPVYILMNKPKDCVTTLEDPHAEQTVIDLLNGEVPERVYPVGRLDKDTTGVLLLTNDGDLATKLMHPTYERMKIYHVFLDRPVSKNDLEQLTEGVDLDGETVFADAVSYPEPEDKTQLGIEIHSGQNRVVRRMMEAIGYKVKKLDRVYFAGLTKKNIKRGEWRYLTDKEINMLKRGIY